MLIIGRFFAALAGLIPLSLLLLLAIAHVSTAGEEPPALQLSVVPPRTGTGLSVSGGLTVPDSGNWVHLLEKTPDLVHWEEVALLHYAPFTYTDPDWQETSPAFYRTRTSAHSSTNDWSNQIRFPEDPFWSRSDCDSTDRLQWAKFLILLDQPHRVYFQDNSAYPLHYQFATARLPQFQGLSAEAFDALSLHRQGQRVVLGSLLAPLAGNEFAIQFVGIDPYSPQEVAQWFRTVRSCVATSAETPVYYLPSYEQQAAVGGHETEYLAQGLPLITTSRWLDTATICYSPGWAVGRLVSVAATSIDAAYAAGALLPTDILLTDAIPSELPFVSGIISLSPATPNSHVALLAESYGVPFIFLAETNEQRRIQSLDQKEILFRTGLSLSSCDITLSPLRDPITPTFRQAIVAAQRNESLQFLPKESFPSIASLTDTLTPSDARYFGGKAANFGLLRRVIPNYSPEAIAFSFDLWDAFMQQVMPDGATLRQGIENRLEGYIYPPNVGALKDDLAFIRNQIVKVAQFSPGHQELILSSVNRFGTSRKIRFRSSTNVEDSEYFSGAGLYDSYSGCLGDDLDGDETGPSLCDATDTNERGVLLAIRKVFASFYNDNAFLERLRLGVNEDQAGMGVLVHYSTPDDVEMANGVATVRALRTGASWSFNIQMVSQKGALSIANPDPGILSEQVDYVPTLFGTNLYHRKTSSLVPFGSTVLRWPADYELLGGLILEVSKAFVKEMTNRTEVPLDLEYKKISPGRLEIKQVREIPIRDPNETVPALLVSQDLHLAPYGSILATHRLKGMWRLGNSNTALTSPSLVRNALNLTEATYREGDTLVSRTNPITQWPRARFSGWNPPTGGFLWTTNTWGSDSDSARTWALTMRFDKLVPLSQSPARVLSEAELVLSVRHPAPVPNLLVLGEPQTGSAQEESVNLYPVSGDLFPDPTPLLLTTNAIRWSAAQRLERVIGSKSTPVQRPDCASIATKAPYAYISRGGSMQIEGLISEPLQLRGDFAQTFILRGREGHETIQEAVADPWMEPDLSGATKALLTAANIGQVVYYSYSFGDFKEYIFIIGLDGTIRRWQ